MPSSARTAGQTRQTRSTRTTVRTGAGRAVLTVALAVVAFGAVGQVHATPTAGGHRSGGVVVVADGGTVNPDMLCSLC
jgi:hypothetical protein